MLYYWIPELAGTIADFSKEGGAGPVHIEPPNMPFSGQHFFSNLIPWLIKWSLFIWGLYQPKFQQTWSKMDYFVKTSTFVKNNGFFTPSILGKVKGRCACRYFGYSIVKVTSPTPPFEWCIINWALPAHQHFLIYYWTNAIYVRTKIKWKVTIILARKYKHYSLCLKGKMANDVGWMYWSLPISINMPDSIFKISLATQPYYSKRKVLKDWFKNKSFTSQREECIKPKDKLQLYNYYF